jgi:hypothetical protein
MSLARACMFTHDHAKRHLLVRVCVIMHAHNEHGTSMMRSSSSIGMHIAAPNQCMGHERGAAASPCGPELHRHSMPPTPRSPRPCRQTRAPRVCVVAQNVERLHGLPRTVHGRVRAACWQGTIRLTCTLWQTAMAMHAHAPCIPGCGRAPMVTDASLLKPALDTSKQSAMRACYGGEGGVGVDL